MISLYDKITLGDIMDKELYIENLYIKLKDEIKFDEDVKALFEILKKLLKINPEKSINAWLYIMQKYNLKELEREIDFTPLITLYILELLKVKDLKTFLNIIEEIPKENKVIIKRDFINIFDEHSGIYQYLQCLIVKKEQKKEITTLKLVIKEKKGDRITFDIEIFLKNVIFLHLKLKQIDISFLLQIASLPPNEKDRVLLQALLIDYI